MFKRIIFVAISVIIGIYQLTSATPSYAQVGGATKPATQSKAGLLCGSGGISTAIGCVPVLQNKEEFLAFILRWAIGVGGGIAFLLILYGGFMVMSSSGNPERLKAGQELLTSAISGLVLLIFSVVILNLIGVKILKIPGFG